MVWVALLLLLIVSGIVSAAETALFSLSPKTLREFERIGGLHAKAVRLMRHPHKVLMTVLLANTVANLSFYAVSLLAIQGFARRFPGVAAGMGVAVLLSVIIFG